jgi:hypothetical protein
MVLTLDQFTLFAAKAEEPCVFRIVLLPGEILRVPIRHSGLRVVSGAAWVSHNGRDYCLKAGDRLPLARTRNKTLVSAEGRTLLLEIA